MRNFDGTNKRVDEAAMQQAQSSGKRGGAESGIQAAGIGPW